MNKKLLNIILFMVFSLGIQAEIVEGIKSTRLIIGFYSDAYHGLGGAVEANEYINNYSKSNHPISLVRPLGNNSILVHINQSADSQIEKTINQLLLLEKVRFIEIDDTMNPLQDRNMGTTPLR
ncbi:hypothetical protein [Endozoicomonas elysicola]|nr:hypothetical protein [Endozoicomonas elysicola]